MKNKNQIIMSAASVSAALSAITAMGDQNQIIETPKASSYDAAALEAISTAKAQAFVRTSFNGVAKTIRLDDALRQEIYAEVARSESDLEAFMNKSTLDDASDINKSLGTLVAQNQSHMLDSTSSAGRFSCYNNCHSACHGSRGWR